ncbi:MAG TPA: AAA family ATPase, partial [Polyangiaceae bacterium]|nr:AAA family ATPase [Polyangiaceae bacterium]
TARAALSEVAPLFPSVRQALGDAGSADHWERDPLETRRRAFCGLRRCLNALGARRPLLLWLEDLHWADADSWALLAGLFEGPELPRCLMLLTHRSDPRLTASLEAWMQGAAGTPQLRIERLGIGPLPRSDANRLVRSAGWTEEASRLAVDASGGNPFLLEQIIERGPSNATQPEELLRRLVVDQQSEIAPDAWRLLSHLALAGQPLKLETAMRAAVLARAANDVLSTLLSLRLVRHAVIAGEDWLELRHDRFREQIVAGLSPADKQAAHLRLAKAMEADACDGAAVACHYAAGLDTQRASRLAEQASKQLAESFAFAQAADLLVKALEWDGTDPRRARSLRLQQAEAFANAGNGPAAARTLLEAAKMTDGLLAIDLRRRAAEQFLGSGHLAEGNALIRPLCRDHGISYPREGREPIVRSLLVLLWLRCRGTRLRVSRRRPASANDALSIELCWTAAKGLMAFDTVRGLYFLLRGLLVALRTDDRNQSARFMALLAGTFLVPGPGWLARWGERLLAQAERTAAELHDPHLRALVLICRGHAFLQDGSWQATLDACDEGDETARTRCIGADWERTVSAMGSLRALEELGRFREIARRTQLALPEVRRRSDAYAEATNLLYLAIALLARGELTEARRIALELRAQWPSKSRLHIQHFYAVRVELHCDLAEGRPEIGLRKLYDLWPALSRSGFLYSPLVRADAFCLRGRLALAAMPRADAPVTNARELERAIHILEGISQPSALARASLLRAGRAKVLGNGSDVAAALQAAALGFQRTESRALLLASEYCLASEGDASSEGAAARERILQVLANLGVLDPRVWFRIELPALTGT